KEPSEVSSCGLKSFIEYFKSLKDDDPSLFVINSVENAITVATVHKAKGLEFPVVILPFLALPSSKTENPFFAEGQDDLNLIYLSKNTAKFSESLKKLYDGEKSKSLLAEINVLYVAMTRAECEMYALVPQKIGASNNAAIALLGGQNIKSGSKEKYDIEKIRRERVSEAAVKDDNVKDDNVKDVLMTGYKDIMKNFHSPDIEIPEFDENRQRGNILHFALSNILSLKGKNIGAEIDRACRAAENKYACKDFGWLKEELGLLFAKDEILKLFLYEEDEIFNEKEIVGKDGSYLRIDKLIVLPHKAIIADFKSSLYDKERNFNQIKNYAGIISSIYPGKEVLGYIADISAREVLSVQ
ncbi:MAG: hypothetical protein LBU09_04285, partial [Endomicrobium sp.]|nr:hypothetical protein [Endomicrobium sp.]